MNENLHIPGDNSLRELHLRNPGMKDEEPTSESSDTIGSREDKRRNEKRRKDRVTSGILSLGDLLPDYVHPSNSKISHHALLEKVHDYIITIQEQNKKLQTSEGDSCKGEEVLALRKRVGELEVLSDRYLEIIRKGDYSELAAHSKTEKTNKRGTVSDQLKKKEDEAATQQQMPDSTQDPLAAASLSAGILPDDGQPKTLLVSPSLTSSQNVAHASGGVSTSVSSLSISTTPQLSQPSMVQLPGLPPLPGRLILQNGQLVLVNDQQPVLPQPAHHPYVMLDANGQVVSVLPNQVLPSVLSPHGQIINQSQSNSVLNSQNFINAQGQTISLPPGALVNGIFGNAPTNSALKVSTTAAQNVASMGNNQIILNQPINGGQHPQALMLPNGQVVPVVTQPNLLFSQCTPTGNFLMAGKISASCTTVPSICQPGVSTIACDNTPKSTTLTPSSRSVKANAKSKASNMSSISSLAAATAMLGNDGSIVLKLPPGMTANNIALNEQGQPVLSASDKIKDGGNISKPISINTSNAKDILARATESIFASEISPPINNGLYNSTHDDDALCIDDGVNDEDALPCTPCSDTVSSTVLPITSCVIACTTSTLTNPVVTPTTTTTATITTTTTSLTVPSTATSIAQRKVHSTTNSKTTFSSSMSVSHLQPLQIKVSCSESISVSSSHKFVPTTHKNPSKNNSPNKNSSPLKCLASTVNASSIFDFEDSCEATGSSSAGKLIDTSTSSNDLSNESFKTDKKKKRPHSKKEAEFVDEKRKKVKRKKLKNDLSGSITFSETEICDVLDQVENFKPNNFHTSNVNRRRKKSSKEIEMVDLTICRDDSKEEDIVSGDSTNMTPQSKKDESPSLSPSLEIIAPPITTTLEDLKSDSPDMLDSIIGNKEEAELDLISQLSSDKSPDPDLLSMAGIDSLHILSPKQISKPSSSDVSSSSLKEPQKSKKIEASEASPDFSKFDKTMLDRLSPPRDNQASTISAYNELFGVPSPVQFLTPFAAASSTKSQISSTNFSFSSNIPATSSGSSVANPSKVSTHSNKSSMLNDLDREDSLFSTPAKEKGISTPNKVGKVVKSHLKDKSLSSVPKSNSPKKSDVSRESIPLDKSFFPSDTFIQSSSSPSYHSPSSSVFNSSQSANVSDFSLQCLSSAASLPLTGNVEQSFSDSSLNSSISSDTRSQGVPTSLAHSTIMPTSPLLPAASMHSSPSHISRSNSLSISISPNVHPSAVTPIGSSSQSPSANTVLHPSSQSSPHQQQNLTDINRTNQTKLPSSCLSHNSNNDSISGVSPTSHNSSSQSLKQHAAGSDYGAEKSYDLVPCPLEGTAKINHHIQYKEKSIHAPGNSKETESTVNPFQQDPPSKFQTSAKPMDSMIHQIHHASIKPVDAFSSVAQKSQMMSHQKTSMFEGSVYGKSIDYLSHLQSPNIYMGQQVCHQSNHSSPPQVTSHSMLQQSNQPSPNHRGLPQQNMHQMHATVQQRQLQPSPKQAIHQSSATNQSYQYPNYMPTHTQHLTAQQPQQSQYRPAKSPASTQQASSVACSRSVARSPSADQYDYPSFSSQVSPSAVPLHSSRSDSFPPFQAGFKPDYAQSYFEPSISFTNRTSGQVQSYESTKAPRSSRSSTTTSTTSSTTKVIQSKPATTQSKSRRKKEKDNNTVNRNSAFPGMIGSMSPPRNGTEQPLYLPSNLFGQHHSSRNHPVSHQPKNANDVNSPFNLFCSSRSSQMGLNFQPGFPPPGAAGQQQFGFGNIFSDMSGTPTDSSSISPIKFPAGLAHQSDPSQFSHSQSYPHQRSHHSSAAMLSHNSMTLNSLLGHSQHHAFDPRHVGPSLTGPPFATPHPSQFAMPPLSFTIHDQ